MLLVMKKTDSKVIWYGRKPENLSHFLHILFKFVTEKANLPGSWQPNSITAFTDEKWWLLVVGGQGRRVGIKLHTLGNSLQKLNLIGTAASWTWGHFKWPELPLTAGGVLYKQHQEIARKRQKKHTWKNCAGTWSKCLPDSSAPRRHADHFRSKAISSWRKPPKTKNKNHRSNTWSKGFALFLGYTYQMLLHL